MFLDIDHDKMRERLESIKSGDSTTYGNLSHTVGQTGRLFKVDTSPSVNLDTRVSLSGTGIDSNFGQIWFGDLDSWNAQQRFGHGEQSCSIDLERTGLDTNRPDSSVIVIIDGAVTLFYDEEEMTSHLDSSIGHVKTLKVIDCATDLSQFNMTSQPTDDLDPLYLFEVRGTHYASCGLSDLMRQCSLRFGRASSIGDIENLGKIKDVKGRTLVKKVGSSRGDTRSEERDSANGKGQIGDSLDF